VGHQAEHIAGRVDDTGDIARRAIDRFGIAEHHPALALQPVERFGIGDIVAVVMRHRDPHDLAGVIAAGEDRLRRFDRQRNVAADEIETRVAHQRAGQQPRLGQHLETVADAEHGAALAGGGNDRRHHRRPRAHRAGTQIVAIGKPAGKRDQVEPFGQFGVAVPDHRRGMAGDGLDRHGEVAVAIAARKDNDGRFHRISIR
jgi:hypothetical protein